jgi:50S ribosomal protein L16 3-hydroxylase
MLKFPSNMSSAEFLQLHWQKQPLFIADAFDNLPLLSPEELAWLATQSDVESRLVFTERDNDHISYRLEHGPFAEDYLASLPERDWTLLVQDVEKHLPELRKIFALIPFIPDWRIDDLMISFAAPGGSVGPHVDQYDVFLCQVEGQRDWQVAADYSGLTAQQDGELSLVEPFTDYVSHSAGPGDALYLPPGIGHWGLATSKCLTYSLGMRAPTSGQLAGEIARQASTDNGLDARYGDADLLMTESEPGMISPRALQRGRQLLQDLANMPDIEFARIFGGMVTDPKAWLAPATLEQDELDLTLAALPTQATLSLHGMAQIAFTVVGAELIVFANGFSISVPDEQRHLLQKLCSEREISTLEALALFEQTDSRNLLLWLFKSGIFEPFADAD